MASEAALPQVQRFSVFTRFRAFWHEVDTLRADVTSALNARAPSRAESALVPVPASIRAKLRDALRKQEADLARWAGAPGIEYYRQAQYVMAACADETFIRLSWSGAREWAWHPLEEDLFGTRSAGQDIFDRIARLLHSGDPHGREMAAVYLVALTLGFEGKYAGAADGTAAIENWKRQLRDFVFGDSEGLTGPLVAQCYTTTIPAASGARLPSARGWWWAAAALVGAWLVVAFLLLGSLKAPIEQAREGLEVNLNKVDAGLRKVATP